MIGAALALALWGGKFEVVPLFNAGHTPVQSNGHTYYAVRNHLTYRGLDVWPGELTDFASIPRLVWPFMPPDGPWAEAAVFHDECYRTRGTFAYAKHPAHVPALTRAECDGLLRDGMTDLGVKPFPRVIIWAAVRLFGGGSWGT